MAGGWVLRSGRGQLRETGSIPTAPPATSRATNPRQHWPQRPQQTSAWHPPRWDQVLWRHQTLEPAERRKGTAQRPLQYSPRSLRYSPHQPFGCGRHHLQHSHAEAFQGTGSRFSPKELRSLPPSSMCTLWTLLLNLSIPDVPFPVLLSSVIRSRFRAKPATLLNPIDFSFPFRGGGALRYSVPKWLLFLI